MKLLIVIIVALGTAVAFALFSMNDPGSVTISRDPYQIEVPLALFVLFLLAVFAVLYVVVVLLAGLFRTPRKLRRWQEGRNEKSALNRTLKGYAGLIEGDWGSAERVLVERPEYCPTPLLNFLGAAYAAQQQGDLERRDRYLEEAIRNDPSRRVAVDLTRARLQLQAGQCDEARALLEELHEVAPGNVPALRLLAEIYHEQQDWPALAGLAPELKRQHAFTAQELPLWERKAYRGYLESAAQGDEDGSRLAASWSALPRKRRRDPAILAAYVRQLIGSGEMKQAEKLLRKTLKKEWNDELAALYAEVDSPRPDEQLRLMESWLEKHAEDPGMQWAMARFYLRQGRREKALGCLREAVRLGAGREALAELGALLEQLGRRGEALNSYKRCLQAEQPEAVARTVLAADQRLVIFGGQEEEEPAVKQQLLPAETPASSAPETARDVESPSVVKEEPEEGEEEKKPSAA